MTATDTRRLRIGEKYRYDRLRDATLPVVDGLTSFWWATAGEATWSAPQLERGIGAIARVKASDGMRVPAILIRSSPLKAGSEWTPWHDVFDSDRGHVRYYGDNKANTGRAAWETSGNKLLAEALESHDSADAEERLRATPILLFRGVPEAGRLKGQVEFHGVGLIERSSLITQRDPKSGREFTNFVYDFLVLDLSAEDNALDWRWINLRRDPTLSAKEVVAVAPLAWRRWIDAGASSLARLRRNVAKADLMDAVDQRPAPGSPEAKILDAIVAFYENRKARFEALAEFVTERVLGGSSGIYRPGWITPASSDGGADFIGRLDVGSDFSTARLVVLGQAKCERVNTPTGGNHIARTVARLKRGWIGVYATTSYFSRAVQKEVAEDAYPIVLIHGRRIAEEVQRELIAEGHPTVEAFLEQLDKGYADRVASRAPEEILMEP